MYFKGAWLCRFYDDDLLVYLCRSSRGRPTPAKIMLVVIALYENRDLWRIRMKSSLAVPPMVHSVRTSETPKLCSTSLYAKGKHKLRPPESSSCRTHACSSVGLE